MLVMLQRSVSLIHTSQHMRDQAAKNPVVPAVHSNAGLAFIKALKGNHDLASIFYGFWGIEGRKLDL
jgi:hypothetical protein